MLFRSRTSLLPRYKNQMEHTGYEPLDNANVLDQLTGGENRMFACKNNSGQYMDKCYECNCTIMVKVGEGFEMRCILPRCKEDVKKEMEQRKNENNV